MDIFSAWIIRALKMQYKDWFFSEDSDSTLFLYSFLIVALQYVICMCPNNEALCFVTTIVRIYVENVHACV